MSNKLSLRTMRSGVPGLDTVLGGGIPEFSFNLVAGPPGSGKTTLAHQIMFGSATPERPALYFTVMGEPAVKMLRYQQQFAFFDVDRVGSAIHYRNLTAEVSAGDFDLVLARIAEEVAKLEPALVFVDSFWSLLKAAHAQPPSAIDAQQFVQRLGIQLASWQATTFLVGEHQPADDALNPVFTVADGIVWLSQSVQRNAMVRNLQVTKLRGQAPIAGLHSYRLSSAGLEVFPRVAPDPWSVAQSATPAARLGMGVAGLDEMMGGGLPAGSSLLVSGPSGSGKTTLATRFLLEGAACGEHGILVPFERTGGRARAAALDEAIRGGRVSVHGASAADLALDETLHDVVRLIRERGATRVVIDSLSGFELALAPGFREEFRESLYRMVSVLTATGASVLMTSELEDGYGDLRLSPHGSAFIADAVILQRYVLLEGVLRRVMVVVKVRGSAHSKAVRFYDVDEEGLRLGEPATGYVGLLGPDPDRRA